LFAITFPAPETVPPIVFPEALANMSMPLALFPNF
jgi:hypothetical protein